jgi:hypothetical protein
MLRSVARRKILSGGNTVTPNSSQSINGAVNGLATDQASEIWERLLAMGKEAANFYVEAYQKTAAGLGEFRDRLGMTGQPGWDNAAPAWASGLPPAEVGDRISKAHERTLEVTEKLQEMSKKATLGYLEGCEQAVLAVADCQEQIAATSDLDFVKAVSDARVGFTREVTKAYVSAARELVG